jgi:hypothetical protein
LNLQALKSDFCAFCAFLRLYQYSTFDVGRSMFDVQALAAEDAPAA